MLFRVLISMLAILSLSKAAFTEPVTRQLFDLTAGAYGDDSQDFPRCAAKSFGNTFVFLGDVYHQCGQFNSLCHAFIGYTSTTIYVVFSGFEDLRAVVQLLNPSSNTRDFYGTGLVNRLVADAHGSLWVPVANVINRPQLKNLPIVFTGYSCGGAGLAVLTAARTRSLNYRTRGQITVWTFGEPRIGTVRFAFWFSNNVVLPENDIRVVHKNDPIARSPLCAALPLVSTKCSTTIGNSPFHRATEYWYNNNMGFSDTFTATCSDVDRASCPYNLVDILSTIPDHTTYYGQMVVTYGKNGCSQT